MAKFKLFHLASLLEQMPDYERVEVEIKGEAGTKAGYARDIRVEFQEVYIVDRLYTGYDPEIKDSYLYIEVRRNRKED